jgi:hypothetical protein
MVQTRGDGRSSSENEELTPFMEELAYKSLQKKGNKGNGHMMSDFRKPTYCVENGETNLVMTMTVTSVRHPRQHRKNRNRKNLITLGFPN